MLAGGEERIPVSEGCLWPLPNAKPASLSSKNAQVGKSDQCQTPSSVSLRRILGGRVSY